MQAEVENLGMTPAQTQAVIELCAEFAGSSDETERTRLSALVRRLRGEP